MARADICGLFWDDTPPPKAPKAEKIKRTPPERTWERPDYLPHIEEARAFNVELMSDMELYQACLNQERLVFDVESYQNYFICGFASLATNKVWFREFQHGQVLDTEALSWVIHNFLIVSFNGNWYDIPILALAVAGKTTQELKAATNAIIGNKELNIPSVPASQVLKNYKVKRLKGINHIDLIEVAPLQATLKIYGGRTHAQKMQDLPFNTEIWLSDDQIACTRWYNLNDLVTTAGLYKSLEESIKLREVMTQEYGVDLRSKSDAQVAEAVIVSELTALNGTRPERPTIPPGTWYRYKTPHFIRYYSPLMQWVLQTVQNAIFAVGDNGSVIMPQELADLKITIGKSTYQMGIGGLHSTEKGQAVYADADHILVDRDVTSYYPFIILLLGLFPQHLGVNFLKVYRSIVDRRLNAKARAKELKKLVEMANDELKKAGYEAELKVVQTAQDSLKITINGSFGKLGSMWSVLYAPDLMIQVTITGQLSLLMLIERLEMSGIPVVSANTDGIVIRCPKRLTPVMDAIVKGWEQETGFETEDTQYLAVFSRDVNNYIAIKRKFDNEKKVYTDQPAGCKTKGTYFVPDKGKHNLQKNPQNTICNEAVCDFLTKGIPIATTIRECKDITKFVTVRTVKGGAVKCWGEGKENDFLGKSIRWYYATGVDGEIVYADSGNKVPRTDGAKPCMTLPKTLPDDIDYNWYEEEALKILKEVGYC